MPRKLRLSPAATIDRDAIWLYTARRYNSEQADAYDLLVVQALKDIAEDPERPTCRLHPEFGPDVRSYHIALSKKRSGTRIGKPRHVVFYTLEYEEVVFVMRIIKDDMDSRRHLDEYL